MTKSKEDAVSPVIGVILMVAVTVILAAVIAAFVFGMGSNVEETRTVAVTADQNAQNQVVFTYQGGNDAADVGGINVSVNNAAREDLFAHPPVVGESHPSVNLGTASKDHAVAIAWFTDGVEQVILDTYV